MRVRVLVAFVSAGALLAATGTAVSQPRAANTGRVSTTVAALAAYPVFFHSRSVRVRGTIRGTDPSGTDVQLWAGSTAIALAGRAAMGAVGGGDSVKEVVGTFFDVGRLTQNDPRVADLSLERTLERLGKPWPGVNELLLLQVDSIDTADPFPAPSVRALSLSPERYVDARVTVSGRFRGRNLFGDQPNSPGRSRWDFVIQSADASIWVSNVRPSGQGFNLNIDSRIDTARWIEVSGTVRRVRHLVVIDGASVRLAQPPPEAVSEPVARVPAAGPPPEVVFSAPTADETDVSPKTSVRLQFSRDLDPTSIISQVRVGYAAPAAGAGEPPPPAPTIAARYDEGSRVLEIGFPGGLEPFRTVKVELLDGIKATDGAKLVPYALTFTLGG